MTDNKENIKLGISIGDLNGIGPEVILKCFEDDRMFDFCTPIVFANIKPLSYLRKLLNSNIQLNAIESIDQALPNCLNILNIWKENVTIKFGDNDPAIGKLAALSFVEAVKALKEGTIDLLTTAPINKFNIQDESFKYPGHTDYLNEHLEGESLMLLVNEEIRVGLLTDHLPLKEVSSAITAELIRDKVKTISNTLQRDFNIFRPRIALLGLNPHAGDQGLIGSEDELILKPCINSLQAEGFLISGPFPADGFFAAKTYKNFDAVLACYHDQGLAPFKALTFGKGVNYTAGLNKIRTSPDHGTGYDIAGKGIADEASFREAIYLGLDILRNRKQNEEAAKNPLITQEKDFITKRNDN